MLDDNNLRMKNINGFDLIKFILCYMVVAIHCGVDHYSSIGMKIAELAVPVYFVISGFLMYKYIYETGNFLHYIKRLICMYSLYSILYLPLTFLGVKGKPLSESIIDVLQGIFIVGENYCSWPLWYLLALIWGAITIKLLTKLKVSLEGLVVVGLVLVLLARTLDTLHPMANNINSKSDYVLITAYFSIFENTRNGLFAGLPFLSLGLMLKKYFSRMMEFKLAHLFIGGGTINNSLLGAIALCKPDACNYYCSRSIKKSITG